MYRIFIDGSAGTTGLRIHERLEGRKGTRLITLPEELRKDNAARHEALNSADIAFLCLPDDAAREAVAMIDNPDVTVIDTSTAHRTLSEWAYGFPELSAEHEKKILGSHRIAVPGCHASGFEALVYPLVEAGAVGNDVLLTCQSLTGYSGGGKKTIAEYRSDERSPLLGAPRQYGISQQHKHLREMKAVCGLDNAPVFCPVIADFYSGMEVIVPIFAQQLRPGFGIEKIREIYREKYHGKIVYCSDETAVEGFVSAAELSGRDSMRISVFGNGERIILTAVYDNLGKGASGAAIECLNMVTGEAPENGLEL